MITFQTVDKISVLNFGNQTLEINSSVLICLFSEEVLIYKLDLILLISQPQDIAQNCFYIRNEAMDNSFQRNEI